MDSRLETYPHILKVQHYLNKIIKELLDRAENHDKTKLESPEVEKFDEYAGTLSPLKYNSDEYKESKRKLGDALEHHYKFNRHHPEHHKDGISGMNLVDIIEMLCDWKASTLRHEDGCINISIEDNQDRFKYSDELKKIMYNTLDIIEKR